MNNEDGMAYAEWMRAIDVRLQHHFGLATDDLPDFPSYDWWSDGMSPLEACIEGAQRYWDMPAEMVDTLEGEQ